MPKKKTDEAGDKSVDILEKILVIQLHIIGVPQVKIAKIARKNRTWVNNLLKGIPKGGRSNADKKENK